MSSEVKRYDAVHLRYEDNNIRYGEGCEVEVVTARDYEREVRIAIAAGQRMQDKCDALQAEAEALRVALHEIASVNPAQRGIEWAKSYASDGLKGAGSELYARWLDTFKEAEALRTELAQAHGRADYWKQRAKSAEGHLWSSDAYAGARALQRYTRFEGTPWDELTGQQQAIIAAGACAVIAEVNARREIRKPTDAALEAENARVRAELEQSRDLIVEMSKHCNATALVADWLERNT